MQENVPEKQYDSLIKNLFKDKERVSFLINIYAKQTEVVIKENLENLEYMKDKEGIKVVYRNINKNIFYLIIYRQKIDINLPYMILNYCIEIIRKYKKTNVKNINIVPIVIYIKTHKYYDYKKTKHCFKMTTYNNNIIEFKYNLINLSDISNTSKIRNTILEELIYIEILK